MTNDDPPRLGDVVGQRVGGSYVVTALLGEDGMGQVYGRSRPSCDFPTTRAAVNVIEASAGAP